MPSPTAVTTLLPTPMIWEIRDLMPLIKLLIRSLAHVTALETRLFIPFPIAFTIFLPISVICDINDSKAFTIAITILGIASINCGMLAINPIARATMISSAALISKSALLISVSTIWDTTPTMVGISSGRLPEMPLAKETTKSKPSCTICGN